jgi:exodeoxyribonuclease VII large subunit
MTSKQLEHFLQKITTQKGDAGLPQLEVFLKDSKASTRKLATRALGNLNFSATKKHLFKMSLDSSITVAKEAIAVVERNITEQDADKLLKAFLEKSTHQTLKEEVAARIELRENSPDIQGLGEKVFQVAEFSQFMNSTFPEEVKVEGELSAVQTSNHYANQWVFFDLKDEKTEAKIRCFSTMYKIRASRISLVDGMRVVVTAKPRISVKSGIFSLNIEKVELSGEGQLLKAFELLKAKLEKEGLFAQDRKRSLPEYPQNIGLITSKDAAAFKDFTKVLKHRIGGLQIHFHHAQVQGAQAEPSIVKALETLASYPLDMIVLTRGGGAMDDLHAFNSEEVARAIYSCPIPVVSAVGHERDVTIADYVADVRASTPSNAAEIIVKDRETLLRQVQINEDVIESEIAQEIRQKYDKIRRLSHYIDSTFYRLNTNFNLMESKLKRFELEVLSKLHKIQDQVDSSQNTIQSILMSDFEKSTQKLDYFIRFLGAIDYRKNLQKGYSILRKNGTIITSTQDVSPGDALDVEVFDGVIHTKIQNNS